MADANGNQGGAAGNGTGNGDGGQQGGDQGGQQQQQQQQTGQQSQAGQQQGTQQGGQQQQGGGTQQQQGGVQLTDEQWQAAFNSPRFKELNDRAKRADELEKAQTEAENKRLAEQGKHEELANKYKADAEQATERLNTERKNNALIVAANKIGAHDAGVVAKLADSGKLTIADDGTVSGADEAVKALQQSNGYLFKTGSTTQIGAGDSNGQGGGDARYTLSQFKDSAYYKEHQADMDKAMKNNQVDMTR